MAWLLGEPQSLLQSRKMKPILKWAGGKTQLLSDLLPKVPSFYGKYIEPFFGGGALFFALSPQQAVISNANGEAVYARAF